MAHLTPSIKSTPLAMAGRLVRYRDLRPCTTAFIDTRTPGSAEKENFTIIGPGVAENPDQHVHIEIPHGFNIGAARQPPGCVNSQHSHETAEVFVIHSGKWAFYLGPNCEDGEVVLGPGDTISIPVHVFRGFKNVGDKTGFMFAVLGGDDPGHVTWAPYVFESAKQYGLVLLEDGSLVDTTRGETIPAGKKPMPPTTSEDISARRRMTAEELSACILPHGDLKPGAGISCPGVRESPVIGEASDGENIPAGKMAWPHGFHLRHLAINSGASTNLHSRSEEEVILMHEGQLALEFPGGEFILTPGDVMTVPVGLPRRFCNRGGDLIEAYIVRGGNQPRPAEFVS